MKPNVLIVFTDQQRWDTLGVHKNPMGLTPNLDLLAKEGVFFENAFTNQPLCAPARACLLTGQYATTHGVWRNGPLLKAQDNTLAHCFKKAGYRTGYVGKWHLYDKDPGYVPPQHRAGFADYWVASNVLEFTSHPYEGTLYDGSGKEVRFSGVYRVDFVTEKLIEFLEQDGNSPFFAMISYLEPHQQNDLNRMVGPEGYAKKYRNPYVPPDLLALTGDWFEQLPDYYGSIARIDECLGRIISALKKKGVFENTIIVFLSDHGCHFHTRVGEYKRSCHDSSIRIPFVMRGPGFNRRLAVKELVGIVDLAPTLLEAAGLPQVPGTMQGKSLVPLVDRKAVNWENEIFVQISESLISRAVRTEQWKYCVATPDRKGHEAPSSDTYAEYQMYDLFADPWELNNLAGRNQYSEAAAHLKERLIAKMAEAGEKVPEILPSKFNTSWA